MFFSQNDISVEFKVKGRICMASRGQNDSIAWIKNSYIRLKDN